MNRWDMSQELMDKYVPIVKEFIGELESTTPEEYLEKDFSDTQLNPFRLWSLLETLGYKKGDYNTNGWELDFWIPFTKKGFKPLQISGCGMTFELSLSEMKVYGE